ncbi:MAG: tyrosine-type recombinase/integrase [Chloroflexi bacterium]|nr:tyrosine-type recombinase/integrase [Chloroflexota bacterium]MCI0645171.1 tyrosine-type recombinase/integrase [Chloroflexota bacterium]MCI0726179.1 tyrosine-type recombinase/integrase [Chloroflexota bacterium]
MLPESDVLAPFAQTLAAHNPKTVRAYLSALRGFIAWLEEQPGGRPFRVGLVTETAVRSYLDFLTANNRSPRTRSQVLTAIRRFGRWAMGEGLLRRNPANAIEPPTIVAVAPRELTAGQRYVLKNRVELSGSKRLTAIFALGYWAGLRVSEIALLRLTDCEVNQRAGVITIRDSKGGKTRTLDLHNHARRALYDYLSIKEASGSEMRDSESAYVFTSQRAAYLRRQGRPDYLTARGIEHLWLAMKRQATQEEWPLIADITFHDLRHDFAHRAREAGWALEEIAVYLGHQTKDGLPAIATTVRYTLPSRGQLKKRLQTLSG